MYGSHLKALLERGSVFEELLMERSDAKADRARDPRYRTKPLPPVRDALLGALADELGELKLSAISYCWAERGSMTRNPLLIQAQKIAGMSRRIEEVIAASAKAARAVAARRRGVAELSRITIAKESAKRGEALTENTIRHIEEPSARQPGTRGVASVTIGKVAALARTYGYEAWQFLVPNFDAANPPVLHRPDELVIRTLEEEALLRYFRSLDQDEDRQAFLRAHRISISGVGTVEAQAGVPAGDGSAPPRKIGQRR